MFTSLVTVSLVKASILEGAGVLFGGIARDIAPRINRFIESKKPAAQMGMKMIPILELYLQDPEIKIGTVDLYPLMKDAIKRVSVFDGVDNDEIDAGVEWAVANFDMGIYQRKLKEGLGLKFFKDSDSDAMSAAEVDTALEN